MARPFNLPTTAAATSSPRRQHGTFSPRCGHRDNGRQGRSSDAHSSSSRNTRPGQKKTRRDDSSSSSAPRTKKEGQKSRPGISSSSNPPRKQKEPPQGDPDDSDLAALKTPRQVIPSLVDVSSGDHLHSLSRSELDLNRTLPLSSATAHARQARVDEVNAAAESIYIAAVKRHYITIDFRKVDRVFSIPFSSAANRTDTVQQLTRSIKRALADVLVLCDEECVKGLAADIWIRGWERPLQKLS